MKFCKLHQQKYQNHLTECPICVGERMEEPYLNETNKNRDINFIRLDDSYIQPTKLKPIAKPKSRFKRRKKTVEPIIPVKPLIKEKSGLLF